MAGEDEVDLPEEGEHVEEPQSREEVMEQKARQQGWKPFEEWDGDPEEWVNPETFLVRGELYDKIKKQNKTINELNTVVDELKRHHQKVSEEEYKKAYEQLKDQKKKAMEREDFDQVLEIDEKLAETRAQEKAEPSESNQAQSSNPEFEEWRQKPENQWYDNNPVMRAAADRLAEEYVQRQNPNANFQELADYVTEQLKQEFPEKFKKQSNGANATVNEPTYNTSGNASNSKKPSANKLSPDQKQIGQKFVRQGVFKNLTEYAKELQDIGEL